MRIKRKLSRLAACAVLAATAAMGPSHAAVDMFLKISGVDGESVDAAHRDSSDVLAWVWDQMKAGEKARATFSDLTLTKRIDKSSPLLMRACAQGTHFPRAVITMRSQGKIQVEFARIVLEDVNVTGILIGLSEASEDQNESVFLSYRRIGVEYFTIVGNERTAFAWNIAENREGGVNFGGPSADSDGDGLPDDWERQYNLDPQVNDAGLDNDRDGATNLEEYIAGSSPIDPNQVFRSTLTYVPGARNATLSWRSVAGKVYRIHRTDTLGTPFTGDQIVPSAGDDTTSVTLPATAIHQFFRVEVSPVGK